MSKYLLLHPGNPPSEQNVYDCPYTDWEIRTAIKQFYKLPEDHEVYLDLKRLFPWLGKEWQDVFILYALGYRLGQIAVYWQGIHHLKGYRETINQRKHGNVVIRSLIKRIQWLLSLRPLPLEAVPYLDQK